MKLAVVLIMVFGVLWLLMRRGGSCKSQQTERRSGGELSRADSDTDSYRSVSIDCRGVACDEAAALSTQRFVLGEAPQLPLAGCDRSNCKCRYRHHSDRRAGEGDRRLPYSLESNLYTSVGEAERRTQFDRRSDGLDALG